MWPPILNPAANAKICDRADALFVLQRLRGAGHVAYFAGGCVRDQLMGRQPKDWDVATDAPPARVRELFPNTQAVGQAFGVILVRRGGSQIEVATFRSDGEYHDGRRPQEVHFTSAEEDARRRDFTINGLFLDPLDDRVIDYVGGRDDLATGLVRAIGDPQKRFEEDHLRLLRAVRFASRFSFTVEPATDAAIRRHAPMLARISPERIAEELRAMLPPPTRISAWQLLNNLGLASVLFRFVDVPLGEPVHERRTDTFFSHLVPGETIDFSTAMAAAVVQWFWWAAPEDFDIRRCFEPATVLALVHALRRSLRLSNEERDAMAETLLGIGILTGASVSRLATRKRFLARSTSRASMQVIEAMALGGELDARECAKLMAELSDIEKGEFAPSPLLTGDDLTAAGFIPGPGFKRMLDTAYDAQLEGRARDKSEALAIVRDGNR